MKYGILCHAVERWHENVAVNFVAHPFKAKHTHQHAYKRTMIKRLIDVTDARNFFFRISIMTVRWKSSNECDIVE